MNHPVKVQELPNTSTLTKVIPIKYGQRIGLLLERLFVVRAK